MRVTAMACHSPATCCSHCASETPAIHTCRHDTIILCTIRLLAEEPDQRLAEEELRERPVRRIIVDNAFI